MKTECTEGHVALEADIGVVQPKAKEGQGLRATTRGWKRQGRTLFFFKIYLFI